MTINQSFQNWTLITDEPGEELVFEHEDPETGQKDRFVLTEEAGLGSEMDPVAVNGEQVVSTSDDLVSILNNASANDRYWLTPGTHDIDGELSLADGVTVRGAGRNLTTIRRTTADIMVSVDSVDNWELRDLTLDGNQSSITSTNISGLRIAGTSSGWTVKNVTSRNLYEPASAGGANHAFSVTTNSAGAPSDGQFINCRAIDYGDDGFSVLADASNSRIPKDIEIINPFIDGSNMSESGTHSGIEIEGGCENITVSGGRINGTAGAAINIGADDAGHVANKFIDVSDVSIDQTNGSGSSSVAFIVTHGNDPSTESNITISGITARGVTNQGARISDADGVDFKESTIQSRGQSCLKLSSSPSNVTVSSVTGSGGDFAIFDIESGSSIHLDDCVARNSGTGAEGFRSDAGVTELVLDGCKAIDNDNHGFQIDSANSVVTNPIADNNGGNGLRLNGSGIEVENPKVYGSGASGILLNAADIKLESPFVDGSFNNIVVNGVADCRLSSVTSINEGSSKIDDTGTRTKLDNVIAGGILGGTDIGSLTGATTGDLAKADGTTGAADALYVLKSGGEWQALHDPTTTIAPA